jgi:hypothetical protein
MATRRASRRSSDLFGSQKIGDWNGVIEFFNNMGVEVKKKTIQAQYDICKDIRDRVIKHILAQDLNWPPLAEATQNIKKKHKTEAYIDTELYLNSIKVWRDANGAYVGVKKGIVYKRVNGNVTLDRVARWMEYGTGGRSPQLPRPLWAPTIEEVGGQEGIRDFVVDAIFRRLKWLAGKTPVRITKGRVLKMVK